MAQVHPSIFPKLASFCSYRKLRKYLKQFGCTKGEQDKIIRSFKQSEFFSGFKETK